MSSVGTAKRILEIAKFCVYVSVPIALTYAVATNSKALHNLMALVCFLLPSRFLFLRFDSTSRAYLSSFSSAK
ncbi:hypothetical protein AXF42_Ash020981 [Apostasia shenzhenica]|uniref:Uncharacterized protein n=1 Tax=Apostasia shenzhenica TaxID=1088818 RepID=A0A2H9ZZX1_9ASPA|nr:hypothetical protein AXF42_Ash020981 [Apostasia shenzhenica]